jgi:hypothetical protein
MKIKKLSLALILAGVVGVGGSFIAFKDSFDRQRDIKASIPAAAFNANHKLELLSQKKETAYSLLEKVFEDEESEKKFRELFDNAKEYRTNPEITEKVNDMNKEYKKEIFSVVLGAAALFSLSVGFGNYFLDGSYKKS